jgi:PAS domain S-box-containing protein
VLLVDDSPGIRELARVMLDEHDEIELSEAEGGEQALAVAGDDPPDLVVVDQNMPGMDGVTTASRLRERHPEMTIVAFTAMDGLEKDFAEVGVSRVFPKSRIDDLVSYVVDAAAGATPPPPPPFVPPRREPQAPENGDETRGGRVSEQQLSFLIRSVKDYAIFLLDPDGYVATWNPGAENIKGYSASEAIGSHFSMFYTLDDRERDHPADELRRALRTGRHEDEGWRLRKDGSRFWASVVITPVHDDEGTLVGFAKVTRDLSAWRRAEESLRRVNRDLTDSNEELDRFASVAAHELQVPLRTISGFAAILQRRLGERVDDDGRRQLGHIAQAAESMGRLVDDLLAYARAGQQGSSRPEPITLHTVIKAIHPQLEPTLRERGASLRIEVPADAVVLARPGDVDGLLRNLLSNAIKYGDSTAPGIVLRARREAANWVVEVIDNGPGIAEADRERIFRAFEQGGIGLGLSIAQRVVERNNGTISVDSHPGGGTCFRFTLPVA